MPAITDPNEPYFKDGTWGWDGSVWRKLPLVWGYSAQYAEYEVEINVAAGNRTLTFSTVPAGEVWVVERFTAVCSTTNPTLVTFRAFLGGVGHSLKVTPYTAAWQTVEAAGKTILVEDDYLVVAFSACGANDNIYAWASGYKMLIAE